MVLKQTLGLMFPYQRTKALAAELTMVAVASAAAAYLGACGLGFITKNMDKDALVSSVQRLIQEFLDTELGGISIQDWLGNVWDFTVVAGKLFLGRPLTEEFLSFAQWVAGKYATQVGENQIFINSESYATLQDGNKFYFALYKDGKIVIPGTTISTADSPVIFSTGYYITFSSLPNNPANYKLSWYAPDGTCILGTTGFSFRDQFVLFLDGVSVSYAWLEDSFWQLSSHCISLVEHNIFDTVSVNGSLSIDRDETVTYIPEGIEAGQGIALDVGAAATMDPDLVLQGVLDDVITGDLTSSMEAAGEVVVDPPVEEEIPDVDNLGLPALGQALTSRFPFSIPWDFFRAVQLLAAPPKAPYFEVDFMAPLADDVGGWQGDTTVILDFSEYAIIGQISRWTSTIGFCLMLAGATKRLIWTA